MRIEHNTERFNKKISDIAIGDFFMLDDEYFIKIEEVEDEHENFYNACDLESGELIFVESFSYISIPKARIIVE